MATRTRVLTLFGTVLTLAACSLDLPTERSRQDEPAPSKPAVNPSRNEYPAPPKPRPVDHAANRNDWPLPPKPSDPAEPAGGRPVIPIPYHGPSRSDYPNPPKPGPFSPGAATQGWLSIPGT